MNVSDQIAEWLHEKKITHAFGIIGAGNATLWDAITRLGKTEIVCHHHEQAAVMASGAYYRISGKIAVALVTTGAGSTNAITGVASCYMDSTPVIVISGNEASKYIDAHTRVWGVQGYDSTKNARQFTKWCGRVIDTNRIRQYLDSALKSSLEPRQGPAYLDIPKDLQSASV